MRIELQHLEAENFLLYKYLSLKLSQQGLVFLSGSIPERQAIDSNNSGKTSVFNALTWVVWGILLRKSSGVDSVIHRGEKACRVRLSGLLDGVPFWIERIRDGGKTFLDTSFASSSRVPDVQKEIDARFGTFESAQNTVFFGQKKTIEFLISTDSQRRIILSDLLKLGKYRRSREAVKKDIAIFEELKRNLLAAAATRDYELTMGISDACHKAQLSRVKLENEISLYEEQCTECKNFLAESLPAEKEVSLWYEAALGALKQIVEASNKKERELRETQLRGRSLDARLRQITSELASFMGATCPTCGQHVEPGASRETDLRKEFDRTTSELSRITASITQLSSDVEIIAESKKEIEENQRESQGALNELQAAVSLKAETLKSIESKLADLKGQLVLQKDDSDFPRLVQICREVLHFRKLAENVEAYIVYLRFIDDAFGNNGIPLALIHKSSPMINHYSNQILADLTDGVFEEELKSGVGDDLIVSVRESGTEVSLDDCSPGIQRRIALSLFTALSQAQAALCDTTWNCRFMDEITDSLDASGIKRLLRILRTIAVEDKLTIVIISHSNEVKNAELFDKFWNVKRVGDESTMTVTA